jgi:hypothetical protein
MLMTIVCCDTGALRLQDKFSDFQAEIGAKQAQLEALIALSNEIGSGDVTVKDELARVSAMWNELGVAAATHSSDLGDSIEAQGAREVVGETTAHMAEVLGALHDGGLGKDGATVSALLRKHDLVQREVQMLAARVGEHTTMVKQLAAKLPMCAAELQPTMVAATARLDELQAATTARTAALAQEAAFYKFEREARDFVQWSTWASAAIEALDNGATLHLCDEATKALQLLTNEVNSRAGTVPALVAASGVLEVDESGMSKRTQANITSTIEQVSTVWTELLDQTRSRMEELAQHREVLHAEDLVKNATVWMAQQIHAVREARPASDRHDDVDALLTDHRRMHSALETYSPTLAVLATAVDIVTAHGGDTAIGVRSGMDAVFGARDELLGFLDARASELNAAKSAQNYLDKMDEVIDALSTILQWTENLEIDGAVGVYREANHADKVEEEYPDVVRGATDLVTENSATAALVEGRLHEAVTTSGGQVKELLGLTETGIVSKRERITEVRSEIEFDRSVDSIMERSAATERLLETLDCGTDVGTASALVDKFSALLDDASARDDAIGRLESQAAAFAAAKHFRADTMGATATQVRAGQEEVTSALTNRVGTLKDSLSFFQYLRDASDIQVSHTVPPSRCPHSYACSYLWKRCSHRLALSSLTAGGHRRLCSSCWLAGVVQFPLRCADAAATAQHPRRRVRNSSEPTRCAGRQRVHIACWLSRKVGRNS